MIKGRGAQININNRFLKEAFVREHDEGIDDYTLIGKDTKFYIDHPKKLINPVVSPDIGLSYSMNPYQGCEHGCVYCYARNSHEYWGFGPGLDFEKKIIIKKNAAEALRQFFNKKNYVPAPIMLSGNTDCYQPIEKKMEITRELLKVCLEFKNPVSIISKNALVLRDLDLLTQLAQNDLVQVMISINSLNEELRRKMEPRTVTAAKRMSVINKLSLAGVPAGVMIAPVIPALNDHEIPKIVELASENGAIKVGYIIVRLNGAVGMIFKDWLEKQFPDRTRRVMNLIAECHGGKVNDSQYFRRMKGSGSMADSIRQLYELSVRKFMKPNAGFTFNTTMFISSSGSQLDLFK